MSPLPQDDYRSQAIDDENNSIIWLPADMTPDRTSDYDTSSFSDSDSSNHTMSTIRSTEVADYFRSVFGFTFPADDGVPLIWPADSTAKQLDVVLHVIMRLCMGGQNVPPGVGEMLRTGGVDKTGARVLDMVTNSGAWVNEMASIYSTASFTSLDTKPLIPHTPHPRIQFQIYDFYAGIMEPDASFDLVHLRQGVFATKNFNFLLWELHRVLKPNGYIWISELPIGPYEGTSPQVPLHSAVHVAEAVKLLHERCKAEGADITAWHDMSSRVGPDHQLWGNQSVQDVNQKPDVAQPVRGFRDIHLRAVPVPAGTWHPEESQKILGRLVSLWGFHHVRSLLPAVMMKGVEEDQASEFIQAVLQEITDGDRYKSYLVCRMWLARKI